MIWILGGEWVEGVLVGLFAVSVEEDLKAFVHNLPGLLLAAVLFPPV